MPVPSNISELSTTPANNSPAGTETPGTADDYLRTLAAFIATLNAADAAHVAAANPHPAYAPLASPSLTGEPTAPTAAPGTKTKQIATTEFVQRSLGNFSGVVSYATSATLTAEDSGKSILLSPGTTTTLPAANAVPAGATFHFLLSGTGTATVQRNGADVISGALSSTSVSLAQGDNLSIRSNGVSGWLAYEGTARMGAAGAFGASLASSGYQKLPSGLIIQWGVRTSVALDQTFHQITFPIAFPNSAANISATIGMSAPVSGNISPVVRNLVATGVQIAGDYAIDAATGNIYWSAIGY